MVQFILLIIGIVALFKKSITVTSTTELRQPKIRIFGIVTIIIVVIGMVAGKVAQDTIIAEVLFWLGIVIPIALVILLKEPKVTTT